MNLKLLSDKTLLESMSSLAKQERQLTLQVLWHLREVERRMLFAKLSYPSLFEYATKELKYSGGAAQRRISSMRLLREIPELETKIESGNLSLSALAKAQSFFRQEKEHIKTSEEKVEVLRALENKTIHQVEQELVSRSTDPVRLLPEKIRPVSQTHSELKLLVEAELLEELEELRCLLSHARPNATVKDLIAYAVGKAVTDLRPKAPKQNVIIKSVAKKPLQVVENRNRKNLNIRPVVKQLSQSGEIQSSRRIPAEIKRQVWQRDYGQCSYTDPVSGKRCGSKFALEYDHIKPFAMGGETTEQNLRIRCRAHNQFAAIGALGERKMAQFVKRLR